MIFGKNLKEYLEDPLSDWSIQDLETWDDKIIEIAKKYDLDWFPINSEICDYYDMIGSMVYHGMPSHYGHWSYGKSFERTHLNYNFGMTGLPYELIINSNPSIAYLMKENPLYLQILIMAHCIGHSDFFKNSRIFSKTRPEDIVTRFRSAKKRVQKYSEDPGIGLEA
ncbi:MAG TPA: stage V sporulation protein R, partial [Maribacter sp.]|nr:stage V sporulation protein R [Maribacter sp.]